MGIKGLWEILAPFSERKPLSVLEGKKVAIDLAGWVCESQCVVDYFVQPKMYLRNLFFRTAYLLLLGIEPVFIIDGEAPELKHKMISRRNEQNQFMGARPRKAPPKSQPKGRTKFNYVLKQCKDLLVAMGVSCIDADGEAEALCAYLNRSRLIDGIISQDSDCFAYGAIRVYRNFSISGKASCGCVDVYDMRRVAETMDLKQNKAVALALLCGCDYMPEGVEGVGKEAVLKLFNVYRDEDILDRLRDWRRNSNKLTDIELKVDDKSYCNNCGHLGTAQKHARTGCSPCRTAQSCDASTWKEQRLTIKAELQIRRKALQDQFFPSEEIICEFLKFPKQPAHLDVNWKQPNIVKFIKSFAKNLQWPEIYCFQKIFPLLTRWQLTQNFTTFVPPKSITKKRVVKGVASYEILWNGAQFDGIFSDEELKAYVDVEQKPLDALWTTVEPQLLVQRVYPDIVAEFIAATTKPPPPPKRKRKKAETSLNDLSGLLDALPKITKKNSKTSKKITTYFPVATTTTTPTVDIPSDFSDCSLDETYSDVINEIVNRGPDLSRVEGRELFYEAATSTPTSNNKYLLDDTLLRRVKRKSYQNQVESFGDDDFLPVEMSFFFEKVANESQDLFEMSLNEMTEI